MGETGTTSKHKAKRLRNQMAGSHQETNKRGYGSEDMGDGFRWRDFPQKQKTLSQAVHHTGESSRIRGALCIPASWFPWSKVFRKSPKTLGPPQKGRLQVQRKETSKEGRACQVVGNGRCVLLFTGLRQMEDYWRCSLESSARTVCWRFNGNT